MAAKRSDRDRMDHEFRMEQVRGKREFGRYIGEFLSYLPLVVLFYFVYRTVATVATSSTNSSLEFTSPEFITGVVCSIIGGLVANRFDNVKMKNQKKEILRLRERVTALENENERLRKP